METTDKKLYERPRMTVVELQHHAMLLNGSNGNGGGMPGGQPGEPF